MVNSSTLMLRSAPVATNAIPMAEAIEGCMVMVIVVVAVGKSTVTGSVNGHPEAGSCSICREGNHRTPKARTVTCPIDDTGT